MDGQPIALQGWQSGGVFFALIPGTMEVRAWQEGERSDKNPDGSFLLVFESRIR